MAEPLTRFSVSSSAGAPLQPFNLIGGIAAVDEAGQCSATSTQAI